MLLISCDTLPASFTSFILTPFSFISPPQPYSRYTTSCNGWSTDPDRTLHAAHFSIVSHSALSPNTLFTMCLALFCAFWPLCGWCYCASWTHEMFSQWITKWQTRENHYQLIHLRHSLCIYANKPTILIAFVNRLLFYNCLLGSRLEKKSRSFIFLIAEQSRFFGPW